MMDYERIRRVIGESMHDECRIGSPSPISGPEPSPESFTYGATMPCMVINIAVAEGDHEGVNVGDANIILPHGTEITAQHRILLTKIHNTTTHAEYRIAGEPRIGAGSVVCACKRVPA